MKTALNSTIQWNASKAELTIIERIAERAVALAKESGVEYRKATAIMDLEACHCNGRPIMSTKTKPKMNVRLLRRAQKAILKHPDQFLMGSYFSRWLDVYDRSGWNREPGGCGTAARDYVFDKPTLLGEGLRSRCSESSNSGHGASLPPQFAAVGGPL